MDWIRAAAHALVPIVASVWLVVPTEPAERPPDAVLSLLRGPCTLVRGGQATKPKSPCPLFANDRLELGPRAEAVLLYPDRAPEHIVAGARGRVVTIGSLGETGNTRGRLGRVWAYLLARLKVLRAREEAQTSALSRGEDEPGGLWPCDCFVLHQRPSFGWRPVQEGRYQVTVLDAQARQLWQSPRLAENTVTYPLHAPGLEPGTRYWWELRVITRYELAAYGPYWFIVARPQKVQQVEELMAQVAAEMTAADEAALTTARALVLAEQGFSGEAVRLLASLAEASRAVAVAAGWRDLLNVTPNP